MKVFTWKQRFVVLGVSLGTIALFVGVGYLIGSLLGSGEAGIILGVLISYPVTQFALLKSIKRLYETETKPTLNP